MAEGKPWIVTEETTIEQLYEEVIPAYLDEIEKQHSQVTTEEWADFVSDLNLETNDELKQFEERPESATSGAWWELEADVDGLEALKDLPTATGDTFGDRAEIDSWDHERRFAVDKLQNLASLFKDLKSLMDSMWTQINEFMKFYHGMGYYAGDLYHDDGGERAVAEWDFVSETTLNIQRGSNIFYIFKVSDFRVLGPMLKEAYDVIFLSSNLEDIEDKALDDRIVGEAAAYAAMQPRFAKILPEINQELDALQGWSLSKQTDSDFKDSYIRAVQALALQKIISEENLTLLENAAIGSADDLTLGLLGIAEFSEDASKIRKKILDALEQEIEEAFADNLIFSEQCFMLTNLSHLIKYKKKLPLSFPLPYSALRADKNQDLCGVSKAAEQSDKNNPLLIQGQPFSFMNKMAVEPTQQALFDIMPHELSSLTPNIRLFKVVTDKNDNEEKEIPITFEISTISPRLEEGLYLSQRGTGVGLKSFKFSYDGTDPFSAKKAISADLSIFASSFNELLRIRNEGQNQYRYTDLALKTGTKKDESTLTDLERENLDKLNFRLKVVVQWSASKEGMRSIKRPEIKDALYDSAITLYLTPVIHTFDFDDQGSVVFNISYQAYIEDFFTNENFNVFSQLNMIKEGRKYVLDFFKDEKGCDLLTKEFKEFQKFDSAFILNQNRKALNSIISNLHARKNIHYLNMSYDEIAEWKRNPSSFELKKIPISDSATGDAAKMVDAAIASGISDFDGDIEDATKEIRASLVANSQENQNVPFFYLSDLISVVMNMIEDQLLIFDEKDIFIETYLDQLRDFGQNSKLRKYIGKKYKEEMPQKKFGNIQQFKKMRIVLGPLEISKISNEKTTNEICTIGDIPISLNYFIDFLSDKVIARDISHYPISKFVKDIINQLLKEFINSEDCSGANTSQRVSVNSTTVVGYNTQEGGLDTITELCSKYTNEVAKTNGNYFQKGVLILDQLKGDVFPLVKISADRSNPNTNKGIEMMTNFYVFSAGRTYPTDKYVGNRAIDASAGIFHYILGQDRGIVKNIKLQKTNTPGLKEVRFEQEGYAGLEQLREVYNVAIDCYLNPQTFPGTYIYIPPEGFSPSSIVEDLRDDNGNIIDLTKFGIGGYYMITKTTHQIAPGVGDTSIEAAWVASKDGKYGKLDTGDPEKRGEGEGTEKVKKCKINSSETGR